MRASLESRIRRKFAYAFQELRALPCGCVTAIYRLEQQEGDIVTLEARGPHCIDWRHALGVVRSDDRDAGRLSW